MPASRPSSVEGQQPGREASDFWVNWTGEISGLVDCIQAIRSFDIVDSPATVEGLFEQHSAKAIPDVKALAAELFADVEE